MAQRIILYTWPIILVTAAICNVLGFVVMVQLGLKRTPIYFMLALICVTDTLILIVTAGNAWVLEATHGYDFIYKLMTDSDMTCKCYNFLYGVVSHMSMMLMATASLDASVLLDRIRIYKRKVLSRIRTSFLVVFTLILLVNTHCFWTFHQQPIKTPEGNISSYVCGFNDEDNGHMYSKEYRDFVWPICNIIMLYLLPFGLIATSLWRFHWRKTENAETNTADNKALNPKMMVCFEPKDLKRMFAALGLFCIIINLPDFFFTTIISFIAKKGKHLSFDRYRYIEVVRVICHTFAHLGRAMKLLVCLMTSTHCRDALFSLGRKNKQREQSEYDLIDQKYKSLNT